MPLYDYKCKDCSKTSEYLVLSDSEKLSCKNCGSENLEKLMSGFAVSVKSGSATPPPNCPTGGCCSGSCGF